MHIALNESHERLRISAKPTLDWDAGRRWWRCRGHAARAVTKKQTSFSKLSLKELEKQIERTASRIREIDELMMDPDVYTDGARTRKLQSERASLAEELEPLEFEWSCRAEDA